MSRTRKLIATARDFLRCKRGNIAMIFGVALVPIMIGAGAGLDFARAMMVRQQMAEALDAAALAVGSTPGLDAAKAKELALQYFNANYTVDAAQYGSVTIDTPIYDAKGSITLTAKNNMPTLLMKIVNINDISLSTTSTVVWGQTKLWVALVLDNSGSMCEPVNTSGPCKNTTNTASKIWQLKDATKAMITKLQAVSATPGDVRVAIVPFNRDVDVGTGNAGASWIDWTYWEAAPANSGITSTPDLIGPDSNCPWSSTTQGYSCLATSANNAPGATSGKIPNSGTYKGMICPRYDDGSVNKDHAGRYYNGCYNSVATQTKTDTKTDSTPTTLTQTCTQVGSGTISCNAGSTSTGSTTSNTSTATTAGWSGDSTSTSSSSSTAAPTDGSKSCSTKKGVTTCTWTRQTVTTAVTTTITKIGVGPWKHTWIPNDHSTWGGCVTDRTQDLDIRNDSISASFTAVNPRYVNGSGTTIVPVSYSPADCMAGNITPLEYDWTDLTTKVDLMQAGGKTNQAIGVAHGWQALTTGGAYGAPALPANTTRYIILFSDGNNTENRWTTDADDIDDRMNLACTAAKNDGVVIYTLLVHAVGGSEDPAPLKNCASDTSKFYELTSSAQIADAFADITKKITNVRVSM